MATFNDSAGPTGHDEHSIESLAVRLQLCEFALLELFQRIPEPHAASIGHCLRSRVAEWLGDDNAPTELTKKLAMEQLQALLDSLGRPNTP